jgi:outer membrane receptor protein involved in Fe transport
MDIRVFSVRTGLLAIALILCILHPALSQVQNASLTGLVTDPTGAVINGVEVTIKNVATNVTYSRTTDQSGYYLFPSLPVGSYTISAETPGFKKAVHNGVILEVGQSARSDFNLEVGGITEVIEVESAVSALETEQATPNTVVQNKMILELPLSLRNWDDLLQMVPGVAGDRYTEQGGSTAAGRTGGVNVHGVRSLQNNFLLDGVDNNTFSENVQELSTQTVHESIDAIQEFKVITNPYSPEFGRSPGAAITVVTKSGTNDFHGAAWEFLRNDKFDSADFFLNRSGAKIAENRQNQFGANLGAPLLRDRLFGFFNYEGTRIIRGQTRLTNVPTDSERSGDFSSAAAAANRATYNNIFDNVGDCMKKVPGAFSASDPLGATHFANNQIPAACLDPVAQKITSLIPKGNLTPATGALNTNNYLRVPALIDNNDSYTVRGDSELSSKQHLYVRYAYSTRFRFVPGAFGGIIDGTGTSAFGRQDLKAHSAAIGHNWIISPRMLNEFRLGWGRNNSFAAQDPIGQNTLASIGILGVQDNPLYSGGLPGLSISGGGGVPQPAAGGGLGRLGSPDFLPKFQKTNQFEESDTFSYNARAHQLKFGVDLHLPMRNIYLDVPGLRGSWNFDGRFTGQPGTGIPWADFLLGYPQSAQLTNLHVTDARLWMASFFFQDEWKATRKLSVNYGLRYDYATWPYEGSNQFTNLDPTTGQVFTPANSPFGKGLVQPDKNNFAPRLGIVYQVSSGWVVRTGYGRFYQLFERVGSEDQLSLNLPWLVNNVPSTSSKTTPVNNMRVATGFNLSLDPTAVAGTNSVRLRAVNPRSVQPSIDQWNLGVQRQLPARMVFTLDYIGTKGTHLSILRNLNQAPFNPDGTTTCPSVSSCNTIPYPKLLNGAIGPIEYRDNMGNSAYHGVEASLTKPFDRGLMLHVAYTYSHSIDMVRDNLFGGQSASIVPNAYNIKGTNRGSSDFDFRHWFALNYVYEVPELRSLANASAGSGGNIVRQILRDWRFTGLATARTGRPFTIYANSNNGSLGNLGGLVQEYGNCVGTGSLASDQRNVNRWFNTGDFAIPSNPARLGNCGRNTMRAPGLAQFDLNLTRSFKYFGEGRRLELRWDMLNAFNNTHFGVPNNDVTSGQFGQITSLAGDPRLMQFALKFIF